MLIDAPQPPYRFRVFTAALLLPLFAVPVPAPAAPGEAMTTTYTEVPVRAMWIKNTPVPLGGTSPFTVRVSTNPTGDAAVGLIEHVLGSAGDTWKSSAWIAAVAASNASNRLLTDHEFLLKVRGFIDGPSAGMMMAATMLALMNQDTVRENVTITGTVNPDGTIGPVSGIEYKMEGAKKDGIKEVGYPMIDNGDGGRLVKDMEKLGADHGIKTVPVADIYQAYEFLTGRKLGRPLPLDAAEMSFPAGLSDKLTADAQAMLSAAKARLETCARKATELPAKLPADVRKSLAEDRERTLQYVTESESFAKEKSVMMAHSKAVLADQSSRMAETILDWHEAFIRRDARALTALYDSHSKAAEKGMAALSDAFQPSLSAPTLSGRMAGFHSYLHYWDVRAQWLAAGAVREEIMQRQVALEKARNAKPKVSEAEQTRLWIEIAEALREVTLRHAILEGRLQASIALAGQTFDDSKLPSPNLNSLNRRLAESYGPAAGAGLAYFESTVIGIRSRSNSDAGEAAMERKGIILSRDVAYSACSMAAGHAIRNGDAAAGPASAEEAPAAVMDRLAAGVYAWLGMAGLMNKYYNLADDSAAADTVTHATTVTLRKGNTVTRMMESSRLHVLEEAAVVKKQLQFIPDSIRMNFSLAETKRDDPTDTGKLQALTSYWRAHFLCRMAQMMARAK